MFLLFSKCYQIFCDGEVHGDFKFGLFFMDYIWAIQDLLTTVSFNFVENKRKRKVEGSKSIPRRYVKLVFSTYQVF